MIQKVGKTIESPVKIAIINSTDNEIITVIDRVFCGVLFCFKCKKRGGTLFLPESMYHDYFQDRCYLCTDCTHKMFDVS